MIMTDYIKMKSFYASKYTTKLPWRIVIIRQRSFCLFINAERLIEVYKVSSWKTLANTRAQDAFVFASGPLLPLLYLPFPVFLFINLCSVQYAVKSHADFRKFEKTARFNLINVLSV